PHRLGSLLNSARARAAGSEDVPLPDALHNWIGRALHLDVKPGFQSATEAQTALEDALIDDSGFAPAPVALETFLSRYGALMLEPPAPQTPAPVAPPPIAIVSPAITTVPTAPVIAPIAPPVAAREANPMPVPASVPPPAPPPVPAPAPPTASRDITELLRDLDPPAPVAPPKVVPPSVLTKRGPA